MSSKFDIEMSNFFGQYKVIGYISIPNFASKSAKMVEIWYYKVYVTLVTLFENDCVLTHIIY